METSISTNIIVNAFKNSKIIPKLSEKEVIDILNYIIVLENTVEELNVKIERQHYANDEQYKYFLQLEREKYYK